jgi:hypothetical protein
MKVEIKVAEVSQDVQDVIAKNLAIAEKKKAEARKKIIAKVKTKGKKKPRKLKQATNSLADFFPKN